MVCCRTKASSICCLVFSAFAVGFLFFLWVLFLAQPEYMEGFEGKAVGAAWSSFGAMIVYGIFGGISFYYYKLHEKEESYRALGGSMGGGGAMGGGFGSGGGGGGATVQDVGGGGSGMARSRDGLELTIKAPPLGYDSAMGLPGLDDAFSDSSGVSSLASSGGGGYRDDPRGGGFASGGGGGGAGISMRKLGKGRVANSAAAAAASSSSSSAAAIEEKDGETDFFAL